MNTDNFNLLNKPMLPCVSVYKLHVCNSEHIYYFVGLDMMGLETIIHSHYDWTVNLV